MLDAIILTLMNAPWLSIAAIVISVVSVGISWWSSRTASRALAISEAQEERRKPQLGIYLANGFRRLLPERQVFGFLVTVSNPSDIDNSIARAELQISYSLSGEVRATRRIQHDSTLEQRTSGSRSRTSVFSLPIDVDAHKSASGLLLFSLNNDAIRERTVDSHRLILEDTHGVLTTTEPIMVREWTDETQSAIGTS